MTEFYFPLVLVLAFLVGWLGQRVIAAMRGLKQEAIDVSNTYYISAKELCENMRDLAVKSNDKESWLRHREVIVPNIELIKSRYQINIFDLKQRAIIKVQLDDLEAIILSTDQHFN